MTVLSSKKMEGVSKTNPKDCQIHIPFIIEQPNIWFSMHVLYSIQIPKIHQSFHHHTMLHLKPTSYFLHFEE